MAVAVLVAAVALPGGSSCFSLLLRLRPAILVSACLPRPEASKLPPSPSLLGHSIGPFRVGCAIADRIMDVAYGVGGRTKLLVQVAMLIVVVQAWILLAHKRGVRRDDKPLIRYGPVLIWDQERIASLNYVYNYNDTKALWMLQMKKHLSPGLCNHVPLCC